MRQFRLGLCLLLVACALSVVPRAQNPQRPAGAPPTSLLMGVIIDPLDGQPVPNAEVRLTGAPQGTPNTLVLADEDGRFVFLALPRGTYTITATKPGYAEGAYGRRRPTGLPQALTLNDDERLGDLKIPIWKFAAVTGRVADEAGEPVIGVAVRALQRTVVAGRERLAPGPTARTDDRGLYRLASLTPGEYAVAVPTTQVSAPDSIVDLYVQRRQGPLKPGESDFMRDLSFSGVAMDALGLLDRHRATRVGMQSFAVSSRRAHRDRGLNRHAAIRRRTRGSGHPTRANGHIFGLGHSPGTGWTSYGRAFPRA